MLTHPAAPRPAGAVTGVGVEVTFTGAKGSASELTVVTPAPGGPAAAAGVAAGDVIEAVAGVATKGLSLYEVSDLLQGPEGSEVRRGAGGGAAGGPALCGGRVWAGVLGRGGGVSRGLGCV